MKKTDVFALYDAIYDELFSSYFPQPELFLVSMDEKDLYMGAYLHWDNEIEVVVDNHKDMKNPWFVLCDTMVHELVHVEQQVIYGRINPKTYHDDWFTKKMKKKMKQLVKAWYPK